MIKSWTVAAVAVLVALINWAGVAHADPAPPTPPSSTTAPSPPPSDGGVVINAPGDYEDSGSGIGDINLSLF
jgi:hypothetical protein